MIAKKEKDVDVLVIIQARMASSRLPGKILMKLDGVPLIQHIILRAKKASNVNEVVLATSDNEIDDSIEELCKEIGVNCFRGSEEDVLARFVGAAEKFNPKFIVRICGDQPIFDIEILEKVIQKHKDAGVDYSTNTGFVPKGLNLEIIKYDVLKKIDKEAKAKPYREHVTKFVLDNPQRFKIQRVSFEKKTERPDIVLTVDTKEDFDFVKKMYFALKKQGKHMDKSLVNEIISLVDNKIVSRKPIILLRADASKEKGIGNVVSLMNIANQLKDTYELMFASKACVEGVKFIKNKGFEVLELQAKGSTADEIKQIKEFCKRRHIKYCIVELYPNDADYVKELSKFMKTMMIDFNGGVEVYSDILLCWSIFEKDLKYDFLNKESVKLLGSDYVPLSHNILKYQKLENNKELKKITISFGGSDPHDLSFVLLDVISKSNLNQKYDFTFIIGPGFKKANEFKEKIKNKRIKFIYSPDNTYDIFSKSDLVISGGGLTSSELAALGIPFIGISELPWEIKRLKKLESFGICRFVPVNKELKDNLLHHLKELSALKGRNKMTEKGRELIDGKGALRIANIIKSRWT